MVAAGPDISVWRRIWYSLLGGPAYREVARQRRGTYPAFLLVAFLTAGAASALAGWSAQQGLAAISALWPGLPDFTLSGGHLVLPAGETAPVRLADGGAVVLVQDGTIAPQDPLGTAPAGLAITAHEMILRPGRWLGPDRTIPLSALGTTALTKAELGRLIAELAGGGIWVGAVLNVLYDVVRDLVRAGVIAWIGLVLVRMVGRTTTWPEAWRIGLAAWTLPMVAEAITPLVPVPAWGLWLVASVYALIGCLQSPTRS